MRALLPVKETQKLPFNRIDPPWDNTLERLQTERLPKNFSYSSDDLRFLSNRTWDTALAWMVKKKWMSKLKIAGNPKLVEAIEPLGDLLHALMELCIQAHALPDSPLTKYKNASELFETASQELYIICLCGSPSKSSLIADLRVNYLQPLKDFQNPFPEGTALYDLFSVSLWFGEKSDLFNRRYLRGVKRKGDSKGFLNCLSAWITALQLNPLWQAVGEQKGSLYAQTGQGRGVEKLLKGLENCF